MTTSTELVSRQSTSPFRADTLETAWRISEGLARSELLPESFRAKPYNVLIALMASHDIGVNPFTVMQHMSVIHGKPRWEVKFLIALANRSGVFSIPIDWTVTGTGADLKVTAFATLARSGVRVETTVAMTEAVAEGWTRNAKYKTMPELMLRYRAAGRLIDLYCPEVRMGLSSDLEAASEPEAPGEATEAPAAPELLPPAQPKRGPGRPRGSKSAPKDETPTTPVEDVATAPETTLVDDPLSPNDIPRTVPELEERIASLSGEIYRLTHSDIPDRAERILALGKQKALLVTELQRLES